MNTTWRRVAIVATALAVAFTASGSPSWAQSQPVPLDAGDDGTDTTAVVHSWALTPGTAADAALPTNRPNLSYDVAPGSQIEDVVTLFNLSNVQLTFRLYATDAFNNDDGAFDLLPGDERPAGIGRWVTLPQAGITVPARSQVSMPITIKVPADARPGDHAGAILAASQAEGTGPDGKLVTLDRRTGSRLYVRVAGPLAPELAVEGLRTTYKPSLNPGQGTLEVTYRIENRGNVRLGGRQRVSVSGPLGLAKKTKPLSDIPELLPGEGMTVRMTFDDVAASFVAITNVHLSPKGVAQDVEDVDVARGRAVTLAFPFSVLGAALIVWLLLFARRSYLRRQRTMVEVEATSP